MISVDKIVFLIAWRYLRSKKQGEGFVSFMSLFSFMGIALGVATLILVMGVMTGFHHKLLDKILSFNAHTTILSPMQKIENYTQITQDLRQKSCVKSAVSVIEGQALILTSSFSYGVMMRGYHLNDLQKKTLISKNLRHETFYDLYKHKDAIIVGKHLAQSLRAKVGTKVTLLSPKGQQTPFGYAPKQKVFKIVGIFDTGRADYNKSFILTSFDTAQHFFHMKNAASFIEVNGFDPENLSPLTQNLTPYLKSYGLYQIDWQRKNAPFFAALVIEKNMMFIVLSLVVLIAAFNIITGLVMMVRDKTRDIGILRAMGLPRKKVKSIFIIIGTLIGALGTLIGVILALIVGYYLEDIRQFLQNLSGSSIFDEEIYYLTKLPVHITLSSILKISGLALILSTLATIYPAWRVGKLNPVEAIRHE
jgi:lipoprotein-releasing system permease protein